MSVRLGCSMSDRIAAIAPVAGVYFPPRTLEKTEPAGCPSSGPVPIIAIHGKADTYLPYLGGRTFFGQTVRSIPDEIMPDWAAHNECSSVPEQTQLTTQLERIRFTGCAGNSRVELYAIEDGDHEWGAVGVNAADLIWTFFASQSAGNAVGGIVEVPEVLDTSKQSSDEGRPTTSLAAAIGLVVMLSAVSVGLVAYYARRRRSEVE